MITDFDGNGIDWGDELGKIRSSWFQQLLLHEEIRDTQNNILHPGLRPPQIGAVYAAMSHWTTSDQPATIVMPTGTGKTETMLALLVARQCQRLLVVVPTDQLREQVAEKFTCLGVLKDFGIVGSGAMYPIVGILRHRPKTVREVDDLFLKCNVVVTTMSIAGSCDESAQRRFAEVCSHMFIDEAHHVPAITWERFREVFLGKPVLQFTATPFRNDGKHVDGKIIYNYPLLKAQQEGYFRQINFLPILEFDEDLADAKIAERAIEQLKTDLANGYDHLLMARVRDINRTSQVWPLYAKHGEFNPLMIHSRLPIRERREAIRKVKNKESRIVICVDMLGEGFDLPELKIAAVHDIHKSLGVTLQFTGRFTRNKSNIGDATFIANIADSHVSEGLASLYGEDADWNKILRAKGAEAIQEQVELQELIQGFTDLPKEIPLRSLKPKMSAVIYRMKSSSWKPENFTALIPEDVDAISAVNREKYVLVFVTRSKSPVGWARLKALANITWDLYVVYWDNEQNLLFINSSNNNSLHYDLAKAVGGDDVSIIKGDDVYRCFHGINRIVLQNVGLNYAYAGPLRYVMYTGIDVKEGLTRAHKRNTFKSNIFGIGYENGEKTSVGCSYKGRVWSKLVTDIAGFIRWCSAAGRKVLDESINSDRILDGVLKPELIQSRPDLMPIVIEWPTGLLIQPETSIDVSFGDDKAPIYEVSIDLVDPSPNGPLKFAVSSESHTARFELEIFPEPEGQGFRYKSEAGAPVTIRVGSQSLPLIDWFVEDPPIIRFVDGSYIENNIHIKPGEQIVAPFDRGEIEDWDWSGVDLKKESQRHDKRTDSIQRRVIEKLESEDYEVVFDDDESGEAADIVTFKVIDSRIQVGLYHCKFSKEKEPGARIDDLYAVCGQAQKSIVWKESIRKLITHVLKREAKRAREGKPSRFEVGDAKRLNAILRMTNFYGSDFKIFIVQPGLSRSKASTEQLELLGSTELYLRETYNIPLGVIASA